MDYLRIYREFIADRKRRETSLVGYVERHHILPRCMGGGDEPENLVALTPEDHFFAHLLLAKAHETAPLWGAVRMMTGHVRRISKREMRSLPRRAILSDRRLYGAAKRWSRKRLSGIGHPMADRTAYQFYNLDGREFKGTRTALIEKFGVPAASVASLFSRDAGLTAYGWYRGDKFPRNWNGPDSHEAQRDRTKYRFIHFNGRTVEADRRELAEIAGVTVGNAAMLIRGTITTCAGWQCDDGRALVSEDHLRRDGEHNARYDDTSYTFVNDDGSERLATMNQMAQEFGSRPTWTAVAKGTKTFRGWRLKGADIRRSTKGKVHTFVNRDGRIFTGTQFEFARAHGMGDGVPFRLVNQGCVSVCGWRLETTPDRPHYMGRDGSHPGPAGARFRLRKNGQTIEGDRRSVAARLGSTPQQISASVYAMRKGKTKAYKGWQLVE